MESYEVLVSRAVCWIHRSGEAVGEDKAGVFSLRRPVAASVDAILSELIHVLCFSIHSILELLYNLLVFLNCYSLDFSICRQMTIIFVN